MKTLKIVLTLALIALLVGPGCQKKYAENVDVVMETNMGVLEIDLDFDKAPLSAVNFAKYVSDGFYDNTLFHRVVANFVIQAGGFTPEGKPKAGRPPIENEAKNGLKNLKYTLSCARTSEINSATTHFFVNLKHNANLDHKDDQNYGYAVFGTVVGGMDVVDKIGALPTRPGSEVPQETVLIVKAKLVGDAEKYLK